MGVAQGMGRLDEDEEEHADLVARVKQLQRDGEESKQQWWSFCEAEGYSSRRDPNRHTVEFLRRFFQARREGRIPDVRPSVTPMSEIDVETHRILVQRVKQAQRSSTEMKDRWVKFCEDYGSGIRDPQRHDTMFIRRFFDECSLSSACANAMPSVAQPWPQGAWCPNPWAAQAAAWGAQGQEASWQAAAWGAHGQWPMWYGGWPGAVGGASLPSGSMPGSAIPGAGIPGGVIASGPLPAALPGYQHMPQLMMGPYPPPTAGTFACTERGRSRTRTRSRSRGRGR